MKIGITGTRSGLTDFQKRNIELFLKKSWQPNAELHHGDCVGADAEVAAVAKNLGYIIVCHPPVKDELRAMFPSHHTENPLSYFARNRNIVDRTDHLIVAPYQNQWQPNGGTWYTHDYAEKKGKPVTIFYPDSDEIIQLMKQGR